MLNTQAHPPPFLYSTDLRKTQGFNVSLQRSSGFISAAMLMYVVSAVSVFTLHCSSFFIYLLVVKKQLIVVFD